MSEEFHCTTSFKVSTAIYKSKKTSCFPPNIRLLHIPNDHTALKHFVQVLQGLFLKWSKWNGTCHHVTVPGHGSSQELVWCCFTFQQIWQSCECYIISNFHSFMSWTLHMIVTGLTVLKCCLKPICLRVRPLYRCCWHRSSCILRGAQVFRAVPLRLVHLYGTSWKLDIQL